MQQVQLMLNPNTVEDGCRASITITLILCKARNTCGIYDALMMPILPEANV